jgi:hypothetical protein
MPYSYLILQGVQMITGGHIQKWDQASPKKRAKGNRQELLALIRSDYDLMEGE